MNLRPGDDVRAYKDALGTYTTGVCVVAGRTDGGPDGQGEIVAMTVNSFVSVSLDPPLLGWCVDRRSSRFSRFLTLPRYGISVLSGDQQDEGLRFVSEGTAPLDDPALETLETGAVVVRGALARFSCALEHALDGGDHVILIGRVVGYDGPHEGHALTYYRSRWGGT